MYIPPATNQVIIQGLKAQGVHRGEGGSSGGAEWLPASESSADALSLQALSLSPGPGGASLSLVGNHSRPWGGGMLPLSLTGGQIAVGEADFGLQAVVSPADLEEDNYLDWGEADEGMRLSLDWYSVTLHPTSDIPVDVPQVQLAASLALGCEPGDWVELDRGSYGYDRGMVGPGGARLWWDAPGRDDLHVSFPGQACQIAGQERLVSFLRYSLGHGGKPTRCDTAMDDHDWVITPSQVQEALQGPDVVTHARKGLVQQGFEVRSSDLTGVTTYLGAPSSRQRLRVYNKFQQSGGKMNCVRWELESHKEAAETMAMALAYKDWGEVMASRLVGFVDFRGVDSHSEVEKRHRLPWFQALVGLVGKASAYLPKAARTVQELVEWIDRAVGPSLAVAMRFWEGDLAPLSRILKEGERRWKPKHTAMLAMVSKASQMLLAGSLSGAQVP